MSVAVEQWANDFHFEFDENLEKLEQVYQETHQASLKTQQKQTFAPHLKEVSVQETALASSAPDLEEADERFIDTLSDAIADRVNDHLSAEVVPVLSNMAELEYDNAIMAEQIDGLLGLLHQKELELSQLKEDLAYYQHLLGPVYFKQSA